MASIAEMITALTTKVDNLSASWQTKLNSINAAKDSAIAATATAIAAALEAFKLGAVSLVYLDAVNGDDANDGRHISRPVKTWLRATSLFETSRRGALYLKSDVTADTTAFWHSPPAIVEMIGINDAGSVLRRKITFVDSTNSAGLSGGIYSYSSVNISTREVDFEMAHNVNQHPFIVTKGHFTLEAVAGVISKTGTSLAALLYPVGSAHFRVAGIIIDPSAKGFVVKNVPADGDPNAVNGYSANFTSA